MIVHEHEDVRLARAVRAAWAQPVPDLRGLLADLWRRRILIATTSVFAFCGLTVLILTRTPVWYAEAKIAIDARQPQVTAAEQTLALLADGALETEIQVLRSHELVREVILDLGLQTSPDFNPALRPPGIFQVVKRRLSQAAEAWAPQQWQTAEPPLEDSFLASAIEEFLANLQTQTVGRSQVIAVSLESTDRAQVADTVNALVDHYLAAQTAVRRDLMSRVSTEVEVLVAELEDRVRGSEQALEHFRAERGLTQGRGISVLSQRLVDLTNELAHAIADRATAEGRLAQIQTSDPADLAIPEVLQSRHIQSMLAEEAVLAAQVAEYASLYGDRHPAMVEIRGKLEGLRTSIEAEMRRIERSLRNAVVAARTREQMIRDAIAQQEVEVAERSPDEARLRQLERTAAADRTLLESLQSRARELGAAALFSRPAARVVTRAQIPLDATGPSKGMLLVLSLPVSLAIGAAAALAATVLDRTPRHFDELETATGVPVTSAVPRMPSRRFALTQRGGLGQPKWQAKATYLAPTALMLGAMRDLHAALMLQGGEQSQAILFTSSVPHEGKTTTAIAFAQMLVCCGRKVLFVDGDLRQPAAHRCLGLSGRPGLSEYLVGSCRLDQVIQHDATSGIAFLPVGGMYVDVSDLGRHGSFARFLEWAKRNYDVTVIDSAPVLTAAETRLLARLADCTVFLVRWSRTPIDAAHRGLRLLVDSGARLAGVTLSMVNKQELSYYHYSDRYIVEVVRARE
jgi:polysaccharide biosynthesis transport protein